MQLPHIDTDSFVLGFGTENIVSNLEKMQANFSKVEILLKIFDETDKRIFGKLKIETPKSLDIIEIAASGAKASAFGCHIEEGYKKIKGVTKSSIQKHKSQ